MSVLESRNKPLPDRLVDRVKSISEKITDLSTRLIAVEVQDDLYALARAAYNEGIIAERLRQNQDAD